MGTASMNVFEYKPIYRQQAIDLMAELQGSDRELSADRAQGRDMADGHFEYLLDVCERQSGKVFVAVDEGDVQGVVLVFVEAEEEGDRHLLPEYRRYAWISDLVVAARGSDAASWLMRAAERPSAAAGVTRIKLAALPGNSRARHFYDKTGYAAYDVIYAKYIGDQGESHRS